MVSARCLRRASAIAPIAAMQVDYSMFAREIEHSTGPEKNILSNCRELGVALVAATPLGRGILTTTYSEAKPLGDEADGRPHMLPRFQGDNKTHNADLVKQLSAFAQKKGCSVTQLALAWLLKQGVFAIPGTRRVKYLEDNWAAASISLSDAEEAELRKFVESVQIAGDAVPQENADWVYSDSKELTG